MLREMIDKNDYGLSVILGMVILQIDGIDACVIDITTRHRMYVHTPYTHTRTHIIPMYKNIIAHQYIPSHVCTTCLSMYNISQDLLVPEAEGPSVQFKVCLSAVTR